MPGRRNFGPMRESSPMPRATCSTLASAASHRFETALMNEIFIARNAFDACLMISALFVEVISSGGGDCIEQSPANRFGLLVIGPGQAAHRSHSAAAAARSAVRAHHDAVRMQKVLHRRAFAQKLRV